jgi:hypothetical protein
LIELREENGGGLPLLVTRKFRALNFEKIERKEKGCQFAIANIKKVLKLQALR